jgi:hypothetical protein
VGASEVADEPADYLADPFCHGTEPLELMFKDVAEVEGDIEVTLHFHG